MTTYRFCKYPTALRGTRGIAFWLLVVSALIAGCAGGMPRIPQSPEAIMERGDAYYKRKMYFQAQELYKAFLQRYPGDPGSDYAQYKLGDSLYMGEEYGLAAVEFHIMVTNYGYSEYIDDAYYKEALCYYQQALKPSLDQTKRLDALERLERFVTVFPDSPLVPEAQEYIQKIQEKLAQKAFDNGKFYFKTKRFRSAEIYFRKILDNYPNNAYWPQAGYYLGLIEVWWGETDEAIKWFSTVVNYPGDSDVKGLAKRELEKIRKQGQ